MQQLSHEQSHNTTAFNLLEHCYLCYKSLNADCDYVAYIAEQLCMHNIDIAQDKCVSHLHVPLAVVHRDQERQQSLIG